MQKFVYAAKISDIPDPGKRVGELNEHSIALFHVAGQFWATDSLCTHECAPLGEGELDGFEIECPWHGARFDIRDGRALTLPAIRPLCVYAVKIDGVDVLVEIA